MKKPLFKVGTEITLYAGVDLIPCTGIVESVERRTFYGYCYTLVFNGNRIIVSESDLTTGFLASNTPPDETR